MSANDLRLFKPGYKEPNDAAADLPAGILLVALGLAFIAAGIQAWRILS